MVFKAVSGVDRKVFDTYNSAHTSSEEVIAALDITDEHHDHYKNRIVLNWEDFGASEVINVAIGDLRKSSKIFGKLRKSSDKVRKSSKDFG